MSTREMAYSCIDRMSEQQMLEFIRDQIGLDDIPNQETLEALAELKYIEKHPEEYKRYVSFEAAIADIMSEDDEVLAMHIDNRAIVLNPEKAEEFLAQKADPKVKAEILRKSKELRKNMIRDDRFKKE